MVQLTSFLLVRSGGPPKAYKRMQSLRINAVSHYLNSISGCSLVHAEFMCTGFDFDNTIILLAMVDKPSRFQYLVLT